MSNNPFTGLMEVSTAVAKPLGKSDYIYDLADLCSVGSEYIWVTSEQVAFIGEGMCCPSNINVSLGRVDYDRI